MNLKIFFFFQNTFLFSFQGCPIRGQCKLAYFFLFIIIFLTPYKNTNKKELAKKSRFGIVFVIFANRCCKINLRERGEGEGRGDRDSRHMTVPVPIWVATLASENFHKAWERETDRQTDSIPAM